MSGKREKQLRREQANRFEREWLATQLKIWQAHVAANPDAVPGVGMKRLLEGNTEPIGMEWPPIG